MRPRKHVDHYSFRNNLPRAAKKQVRTQNEPLEGNTRMSTKNTSFLENFQATIKHFFIVRALRDILTVSNAFRPNTVFSPPTPVFSGHVFAGFHETKSMFCLIRDGQTASSYAQRVPGSQVLDPDPSIGPKLGPLLGPDGSVSRGSASIG